MGNIGPSRELYDVLPALGVEDTDLQRLDLRPSRERMPEKREAQESDADTAPR